jgi:V8-like Glu-specific endopeptidase
LKVIGHQTGQTAWSVMAFTPLKSNEQQIILDGSLLPGASGSPVLNGSGEVLGLVYETTTYAKQSMDLVSAYRTAVIQRLLP